MAANTSPIFLLTPVVSWASTGTAANTNLDGTGTTATVFTAGANGSRIDKVVMEALGTNVATVVRLFLNSGASSGTPANNTLIHEEAFAANTLTQTDQSVKHVVILDLVIPAGYKLLASTGTAIASGIQVTAVGGNF